MSTKGTRIPEWLDSTLRRHHAGANAGKGAGTCSPPATGVRSGRCTRDKLPPCNNACGTNEKIQGYLDHREARQISGRLRAHQGRHALPFEVTGACVTTRARRPATAASTHEAISIRAVERFLGDLGQALQRDVVKPGKPNGKKVAVVGSGPAGHSAAYQLARLGYKVTILEKSPKAGGLNRGGIPDWVLPQNILDREIERLIETRNRDQDEH